MQLMDLFNNLSICPSETDAKALLKERQKKDNHNLSKSVQIISTSLNMQRRSAPLSLLFYGFFCLQMPNLQNLLVFFLPPPFIHARLQLRGEEDSTLMTV